MTWQEVMLKDVGVIYTGSTPKTNDDTLFNGDYPFVTPGDLFGSEPIFNTDRTLSEKGAKVSTILPAGSVLVCCIGSLGKIGISGKNLVTNQQINAVVFEPSKVDSRFGYYACAELKNELLAMAPATTVPIVNKSRFSELKIPLPPLPEQKRIAAILDKADEIRRKREAAIAKLDQLAQSIFVEMFGDVATNDKGWNCKPLADLCDISGEYGAGVASTEYDPSLPTYIRITDITDKGDLANKAVSPAGCEKDWANYRLEAGDVLFARSGATVGKTYLHQKLSGHFVFAGYLIRFRPKRSVLDSTFLFHFTKTKAYKSWVQARQRVVAQPNINAKQYGFDLLIPIPPLELQRMFSNRINKLEQLKANYNKALTKQNQLFTTLQHQAFTGAL